MEFIENPRMHPITRSKIIPGSGTYNKCLDECIKTLGDNSVPAIVASSIIKKANKTHKERADSEKACLRMINEFSEFNIERNATVLEVIDPFSQNNKLRKYALGSHEADIIREACESEFGIISLDILVPETDVRNIRIPVFLHHTNEGISISNFEDVRSHISEVVERWTRRTPARDDVYDAFIAAIQKIIDSRFLNGESRASLEDIVMELTAMKKGIVMGAKTPESPISSPMDSVNRSKSKSVPSKSPALSPLPKKTRAEILEDLEKACIEMKDIIMYEDFEDMKKKKLQLVVGIGPKNAEGQQRCYYVKNIYNFIRAATKANIPPKEPGSKAAITRNEITNVIMPKMRYLKPDARDPTYKENLGYPKLELVIRNVVHRITRRHYFEISLTRYIGNKLYWSRTIGYIAGDIEITEGLGAGVTSGTVISKIRELFDEGLLLNPNMTFKVHLNKSLEYWDDDEPRKLQRMLDELESV
jgi:hypothetical protein